MPTRVLDIDTLIVSNLHRPMLNELMVSALMRAEMGSVANEIKRRWVAKFPKETGNAASTAAVTYHRSHMRDRRWEAEFSAGGPKAPYVPEIEAEQGILASVLAEMGYFQHGNVLGPTHGRHPRPKLTRETSHDERQAQVRAAPSPHPLDEARTNQPGYEKLVPLVERVQSPGRRPGSAAMERDVAELRALTAEVEREFGRSQASLGRVALSTYDQLKAAREERDRS